MIDRFDYVTVHILSEHPSWVSLTTKLKIINFNKFPLIMGRHTSTAMLNGIHCYAWNPPFYCDLTPNIGHATKCKRSVPF